MQSRKKGKIRDMAISTEEIVRQLTAFFPDRIIYKQEFSYKYIGYALDRAIRCGSEPQGSIYDERDLLWI